MNFDELLKEAKEKDKQGKAKAKVTLGSVGTKKTLPIPLASPSKAGEERAESALFRSQKTPAALAEEKSVVNLLPRAIGAGLAQAPLNIAKAVPALAAATLAEGGTSKRYEESNQYQQVPVSAEQLAQAQRIASVVPEISYPGTKLDEFIANTEKQIQELKTPGNKILAQVAMAGGQMAPVIASGGLLGAGVGYGTLGAQAYGQSFGQAIEQGSDVKTAGQYAALSSALELATETLVGGIPGLGKGLLSKIIQTPSAVNLASRIGVKSASNVFAKTASAVGKTLSSKGGRLLVNAFGEGIEEVIAEYLAPSIERSTIDPNAPDATISELAESFAVGGLLSALLGVPSITLSNGKTITKLDDVDTLTATETKEFEDELYRLARESNIRKGKITPEGEPIEAMSATDFANMYGLPTPAPKRFNPKTIPLYSGGGLIGNEAYTRAKTIYDNQIKDLTEYIKNYTPKGTTTYYIDENGLSVDPTRDITGNLRRVAVSNNDTWYSDFWKQNNRKPTKGEAKEIAQKIIDDTLKFETDDGFAYNPELIDLIRNIYSEANGTALDILNRAESDSRTFQRGEPAFWGDVEPVKPLRRIKTKEPIPQRIIERPFTVTPAELATTQTIPQTSTPQPAFEPLNRPVGQTGGTLLSPQNELETQDLGIVGIPSEKTAKYAETVQEFETVSKELSDEIINTIQQGKLEGTFKSNKAVVENANNYIAQGLQNARGAFDVSINDNRYTSESIALGARLVQEYQKIGDLQNAMSVLSDLAFALQAAGQKVQAAKILKKLTPEGRLKTLAALKNKIEAAAGVQVELSDEILKQVSEAKTENEMAKAFGNARIEIWNKIPATFEDKFNAWRYTSMLGNPKTIMRNEIGNALFAPVRTVKNIIASGLEKVARIPSGANALEDNIERFIETGKTGSIRTKSILTNTDKDLVQFALKDTENVLEILKGDSKYGDLGSAEALTSRPIGTKVFNQDTILGRAIQKWSDVTTKALEDGLSVGNFKIIQGDASWLERIYSKSLAQFMKANNLNESDMTGIVLDIGRAYAIQEAKKGTYRDANIVSSWLSKNIRKGTKSDKLIPKAIGYIAEGAIPFKRTPMNIARRAIEYSPIGLINGVASTVQSIKNGENISVALDKLAAGLTGTGVVGLGMFLASLGLLSGGDSGDDKEEKYKDALGVQNYALQIGDKSYTVDWAAPSSIPLFVGVELYNQLKNGFELSDMLDAMKNVSDPLLEMSMLQGIANIMDTGYSQGGFDVILTPIKTSALSLAGQAVPTVFGQIARTIDPSLRRTNTSDAKSPALKDIEYGLKRNILSKIPVAQQTRQPYVDLWGRTPVKTSAGDYVKSALENFLSVGYVSEENITSVDRQIISIYKDTEDNSVIPRSTTGYDIKVAGEEYRMSEDEKTEFQKNRGKQSYDKLKSLFLTNEYGKMTTEERVKAINDVYDDAYEVAKKQLAISRGMKEIDYNINTLSKESKAKIDSIVSAGIPKNTAYNIFIKKDANGNGSLSQDELMQVISLSKTTQKQKAALWDILKVQTWKKQNPFLQ